PAVGPGGRADRTDPLAALRPTQVGPDRPLSLVEARPEQALTVRCKRPAVLVEAAAPVVEANDVGAQLRERHAPERGGDARPPLHYAQAPQNPGVHGTTP